MRVIVQVVLEIESRPSLNPGNPELRPDLDQDAAVEAAEELRIPLHGGEAHLYVDGFGYVEATLVGVASEQPSAEAAVIQPEVSS